MTARGAGGYRRWHGEPGRRPAVAVHPAGQGRIGNADKIDFGLMGAELVRLATLGRAEVADGRIAVVDAAPTGDAELDAALKSLAEAGRPPKATAWVGKPRRGIRGAYLARLAEAGVIQMERTRFLGIPTGSRLHLIDGARVADARARLDAIALSSGPVDVTQAAYGGLAYATGLASLLYRGRDGRQARKRLAEVANGKQSDAALGDVIEPGARQTVTDPPGEAASEAATEAAVNAASDAAVRRATDAAVQAANDAAVQAAVQAANAAAVHAAVHAANHAASHAGGHAGGAGGHGH
jgi:Golgi phosphoprotein 3 (GPP34)